jgi:hypothetical protein
MQRLPPWTKQDEFGPDEWRRYFDVARICQQQSDDTVACALRLNSAAQFVPGADHPADFDPDSVPYILLRIMFVGPETAAIRQVPNGKGWRGLRGDEFLSWPVIWVGGRPRLAADYRGCMGPYYDPAEEFLKFRQLFRYRDIDSNH